MQCTDLLIIVKPFHDSVQFIYLDEWESWYIYLLLCPFHLYIHPVMCED